MIEVRGNGAAVTIKRFAADSWQVWKGGEVIRVLFSEAAARRWAQAHDFTVAN